MTEFKTRAEIEAADEFIQYLELLRSGSLATNLGVNRALERLAENLNAAMETLQMTKGPRIAGGGNISFGVGVANQLAWDNPIYVFVGSELTGCQVNLIQETESPKIIPPLSVMYIIVDRSAPSVDVIPVVDTYANFLAAVAGSSNRLDYVLIAFSGGDSLLLADGHTIRSGFSLDDGLSLDDQYGQQSEVTLIRGYVKENLKLLMTGGGTISWDAATGTLTFNPDNLRIEFPSSPGRNEVAAGPHVVGSGEYLYVELVRDPPGVSVVAAIAAAQDAVPTTDNTFVIGYHGSDGRFYFWNGTVLNDGDSIRLGGIRTGVQWFYGGTGIGGVQVSDFSVLVSPTTTYRVGSGELMVYRNGLKATASKAYWEGVYPTGSLNTDAGPIQVWDDYVEEDRDGVGSSRDGNRIIWLRELPSFPPPVGEIIYFDPATFPPGFAPTWPDPDDYLEAFIGVEGNPPTLTIPDGIYGFETVWVWGVSNAVRCGGGTLVVGNLEFINKGNPSLTLTTADMFGTEVLVPDAWHYIYLGPGPTPGGDPAIVLSVQPPDNTTGGGAGTHPDDSTYKFLSSAYIDSVSNFTQFVKEGSRVIIGDNEPFDASAAFPIPGPGFVTVNLAPYLPGTYVTSVKIRLVTMAAVAKVFGDKCRIAVGQTSIAHLGASRALFDMVSNTDSILTYEFEVPCPDGQFDIQIPATDHAMIIAAFIAGYTEGRRSTGTTLG